jgi:hypothetical protein
MIDLDFASLSGLVDRHIKLLGEDWLSRRLKKDDEERLAAQGRAHRKLRVRQQARHPVVQWYREYLTASAQNKGGHDGLPGRSVVLLATFCSNLGKTKDCAGMAHILERLRKPEEFHATAFEIEVAASYLNRGWTVEFIETGRNRSPDLEVTRPDGSRFWAECKRKDEMTERDLRNEAFFDDLKDRLYKAWGPSKQNFGLQIEFAGDPQRAELNDICELSLELGRQLNTGPAAGRLPVSASTVGTGHTICLHYLADPDVAQAYVPIDYGGDSSEFMAERTETLYMGPLMRNPKVFDFRLQTPPDKYQSVINSFNSAVGQIPESGPGVIWIRIPFPDSYARAAADLDKMLSKVQGELTGGQNRRVNAVLISARWFSDEPNEGKEAISYRHDCRVLEHPQPRSTL